MVPLTGQFHWAETKSSLFAEKQVRTATTMTAKNRQPLWAQRRLFSPRRRLSTSTDVFCTVVRTADAEIPSHGTDVAVLPASCCRPGNGGRAASGRLRCRLHEPHPAGLPPRPQLHSRGRQRRQRQQPRNVCVCVIELQRVPGHPHPRQPGPADVVARG